MEFQYNFLLFCRCEKSLNRCFGANERDTFGATHFSPFLASFFFGSLRKSGGICYMKSESFRLLLNNTSWSYSSKCHQFCNGFLEWINAKVHPLFAWVIFCIQALSRSSFLETEMFFFLLLNSDLIFYWKILAVEQKKWRERGYKSFCFHSQTLQTQYKLFELFFLHFFHFNESTDLRCTKKRIFFFTKSIIVEFVIHDRFHYLNIRPEATWDRKLSDFCFFFWKIKIHTA